MRSKSKSSHHPSIGTLAKLTDWLLYSSISNITRASYHSAWRSYFSFCLIYSLQPLPASSLNVLTWMGYLFYRGLLGSSIRTYVMALSSLHNEYGLVNNITANAQIARCISGVVSKRPSVNLKPKLPITPTILWSINSLLNMNSLDDAMLWAAFTLGTCSLLRNGEIAASNSTISPCVQTTYRVQMTFLVQFTYLMGY